MSESRRTGCCFPGNANCCCCRVEWAMWANINALYAAAIMFVGGVVGATVETITLSNRPIHSFGAVTRWIIIPISLVVFFIEYPRSARKNKKTPVERLGQKYIAPLLHITGFFGRNYIIRFILYVFAIIPCISVLSTILGGMCLAFANFFYFMAALNGEQWKAPSLAWGPGSTEEEEQDAPGHTLPEAPSHPPPRPPPQLPQDLPAPPSQPPPRPVKRNV